MNSTANLILLDLRAEHKKYFPWGYGISPQELDKLAHENKLQSHFYSWNRLPKTLPNKTFQLSYSAVLYRKNEVVRE